MRIKFLIIKRKRVAQNRMGFYRSGIYREQRWYGLEIPHLDFRIVRFL